MDIYGTAGDDTMEYLGGPGIHIWVNLWGGAGNDIIRVSQVTAVGEAGNDTIIGVKYEGAGFLPSAAYWNSPSGITANLATGTVLDGFGTTDTLVNIRSISDSPYNDHITGSAQDDLITLSRGSDTVIGGGGKDTVNIGLHASDVTTTYDIGSATFTLAKHAPIDQGTSTLLDVATLSFSGVNTSVTGTADGGVAYHGGSGRDIVHSGKGNDTVDGAGGLDTVIFAGNRASYTVTRDAAGVSVSGAMGLDTLTNIERIEFGDKGIAFDSKGVAGQAFRLYQAAFNRAPDAFGLGFWISRLDLGVPLQTVAGGFASSKEFADLYGASTTVEVVAKLYENILRRPGDPEGAKFWAGVLDRKEATMAEILAGFSESGENVARTVGVMQNGLEYLPYA